MKNFASSIIYWALGDQVSMQLGDTFVLGAGGHLWIVISDSTKHGGHFIIVNLTTDVFRAGTECVLNPGDHPWITQTCYVSFGDARSVNPQEEAKIVGYMATRVITQHHPMKASVLQKIIAAGKLTKAMSNADKALL
jgi:hypothetical protein